jgi:SAM-dependent methyltransferase
MATTVPIPPPELDFVGGGPFDAIGREFVRYFIEFGGLKPHHRVLDIGCGIGRMARPLTEYLSPAGSFEGIDIVGRGIDWCTQNITTRYPKFRFQQADVYNELYNPAGQFTGDKYGFPFPSGSFDFVYLTSVFTHMRPAEVAHYISEINRVLKPGGKCFCTFFLRTPETRVMSEAGRGKLNFIHRRAGYWIALPEQPDEAAIAYDEPDVMALFERFGFVSGPIRRGSWSGRAEFVTYQDLVCIEKICELPQAQDRAWSVPGMHKIRAFAGRIRRRLRRYAA